MEDSIEYIVDYAAAKVSTQILNPKLLTPKLAQKLKSCESNEVAKNIEILQSIQNA